MGILYIVSTPIGNLDDITLRAIRTLANVDIILAEDTRKTSFLLEELIKRNQTLYACIKKNSHQRLLSFYDEIESQRTPEIIELLVQDKNVALVSDAGTPLISDPGFKLVEAVFKRSIKVVTIPGPAALISALSISGLPADKFIFLGYPPEKKSHRLKIFHSMFQCFKTLKQKPTVIFYCPPHKLKTTLEDLKEVSGDIEIVIARELTKIHEEVWKGHISEALLYFANPKGEIVVLFKC